MTELSLGAKRYDGASGSALFSGTIPLKPGQLFETQLGTVSLWEGATERGVVVQALSPLHPDDSLKVIQVHAQLTVATGEQKSLTLKIGVAPTVPAPVPAVITIAWMRAPRLLGCTDAAHLCASRIATMPLVPLADPNLPTAWRNLLSTEFDLVNWLYPEETWVGTDKPTYANHRPYIEQNVNYNDGVTTHFSFGWGGNASYDGLSPFYLAYLIRGDLDYLRRAHQAAVYDHIGPLSYYTRGLAAGNGAVTYDLAHDGVPAGTVWTTDWEYGLPATSNPQYGTNEVQSGFHLDMFLCYCLSGWKQAREILIVHGIRALGPNYQTAGTGRNDYTRLRIRMYREAAIYYYLLSLGPQLRFGVPGIFTAIAPSPRDNKPFWLSYFQSVHYDTFEQWSETFPTTDFRYHLWGLENTMGLSDDPASGGWTPNFQLTIPFNDAMTIYLNILQDARVPERMAKIAAHLVSNSRGPFPFRGHQMWEEEYGSKSPALVDPNFSDGTSQWALGMFLPVFTWAWRYNGSALSLARADAHATSDTFSGRGWKQMGELWSRAFFGAAWRAGVPFNGWEISGTPPPPPPPPPPTGDPMVSVSPNPAQPGAIVTVTFSGGFGHTNDWIGLYDGTTQLDWKYLNNTQSQPGTPILSGTVSFTAPTPLKDYQIQFYEAVTGPDLLREQVTLTVGSTFTVTTPTSIALTGDPAMAQLNAAITNAQQQHTVSYTGVRVRFQRSTDNGVTWVDVQSLVKALGTTSDAYTLLPDTAGEYRVGATLTNGTVFGTEVFSNVLNVALLSTPTSVTLTVTI